MRFAALLLCLTAATALAQDGPTDEEKRQQAEQRADMMLRWMGGQLELSETQKEKMKSIMVEAALEEGKVRDKHSARIRELLTPEQRETYDGWQRAQNRARSGAGRGGNRGGRGGGFGGMGGMNALRELNLTPEQEKKVQAIYQKQMGMWGEARQKMQAGEQVDWRKMIVEFRKKTNKEVRALLDETQKRKFDEINKRYDDMMKRWGIDVGGDDEKKDTPKDGTPIDPATRAARMVDDAIAVLQCSKEEEAIFRPLIDKLVSYKVNTQVMLAGTRKQLKDLATSGAAEDALTAKLSALKAAEGEFERKLSLLEEGVRELLTKRQEIGLIGLGVLRAK